MTRTKAEITAKRMRDAMPRPLVTVVITQKALAEWLERHPDQNAWTQQMLEAGVIRTTEETP